MNENPLMCENLKLAKKNRERVRNDYCGEFYAQQTRAVAQWGLGEKKPDSVILGELPYVDRKKLTDHQA